MTPNTTKKRLAGLARERERLLREKTRATNTTTIRDLEQRLSKNEAEANALASQLYDAKDPLVVAQLGREVTDTQVRLRDGERRVERLERAKEAA